MTDVERGITSKKRTKRIRVRTIAPDVLERIVELGIGRGIAGTEVHRRLQDDQRYTARLPSLRTVQDIIRQHTPRATSAAWVLADVDEPTDMTDTGPDEIPFVMDVLAAVIAITSGRQNTISLAEVKWVVKLHRAAPDLPRWGVYRLARRYLLCQERNEFTADLDAFLAFAPWRSQKRWELYLRGVRDAWFKEMAPLVGIDDREYSREDLQGFSLGDGGRLFALESDRHLWLSLGVPDARTGFVRGLTDKDWRIRAARWPDWDEQRAAPPMAPERRAELLSMTPLGRQILMEEEAKKTAEHIAVQTAQVNMPICP